jgi:hypothetical protein
MKYMYVNKALGIYIPEDGEQTESEIHYHEYELQSDGVTRCKECNQEL